MMMNRFSMGLGIATFFLWACNSEDGIEGRRQALIGDGDSLGGQQLTLPVVETAEAAGPCKDEQEGMMVFASDRNEVLVCDGEGWQPLNAEEEEPPATEPVVWVRDAGGALVGQSTLDTYLGLNGYLDRHVHVILEDHQVLQLRPSGELSNQCFYESEDCSGPCLLVPGKIYIAAGLGNKTFKLGNDSREAQVLSSYDAAKNACIPDLAYHEAFVVAEPYDLSVEADYPFAGPLRFEVGE